MVKIRQLQNTLLLMFMSHWAQFGSVLFSLWSWKCFGLLSIFWGYWSTVLFPPTMLWIKNSLLAFKDFTPDSPLLQGSFHLVISTKFRQHGGENWNKININITLLILSFPWLKMLAIVRFLCSCNAVLQGQRCHYYQKISFTTFSIFITLTIVWSGFFQLPGELYFVVRCPLSSQHRQFILQLFLKLK